VTVCVDEKTAKRFIELMRRYMKRLWQQDRVFDMILLPAILKWIDNRCYKISRRRKKRRYFSGDRCVGLYRKSYQGPD